MSGYIGTQPVPQATQHRETFTATASQTTFATVGYTPQFVDVYLNGIHLLDTVDYTATNSSDVVLTTGAAASDVVEIISYTPFEVANQTFTGTTTVDVLTVTGGMTGTLVAGAATYGGTADVIAITTGLSLTALTTGMETRFRATAANTGATTINVDAIGAVTVLTVTGAALPADYIRTDVDTVIRYNGTNWIADRQVERGSNTNGEYTRWADGSMFCTFDGSVAKVGLSYPKTYPAAFISLPTTSGSSRMHNPQGDSSDARNIVILIPHTGWSGSGGTTTAQWDMMGKQTQMAATVAVSTATLTLVTLSAVGFWY